MSSLPETSRAEVCAVACAEVWRGDGEKLVSAFGTLPAIGARLARLTFEPDLVLTDGEAQLVANTLSISAQRRDLKVEGWLPFRKVFDVAWSGRRHAMMMASQLDRFGNHNISCIGDWHKPKAQLVGVRGAPGNTVNHPTSYWVPAHSPRVFVEQVDMVCGVGFERAEEAGPAATRYHDLRFVVTNLAVLDFQSPDRRLRLRSVHPGVTVSEVIEATGFELVIPKEVASTRLPAPEELNLIRRVIDPESLRDSEVAS